MGLRLLGDVRTFRKMRLQALLGEVQIHVVDIDGWKTRWKALMPTERPKRDSRVRELTEPPVDQYFHWDSCRIGPPFQGGGTGSNPVGGAQASSGRVEIGVVTEPLVRSILHPC